MSVAWMFDPKKCTHEWIDPSVSPPRPTVPERSLHVGQIYVCRNCGKKTVTAGA